MFWVSRVRYMNVRRRLARERARRRSTMRLLHSLQHEYVMLEERYEDQVDQVEEWKTKAQSSRCAKAIWDMTQQLQRQLSQMSEACQTYRHRVGHAYEIDDSLRS